MNLPWLSNDTFYNSASTPLDQASSLCGLFRNSCPSAALLVVALATLIGLFQASSRSSVGYVPVDEFLSIGMTRVAATST